ncbi:MAG: asparagine synthase (glutamine-hydrolyzing) [Nitrospinota bacterium]
MCGINGFWGVQNDPLLHQMTGRLKHRGPDSKGFFSTSDVSLGMRRLSIIDVKGGRQPIFNETGRIVTIYNGEIYNYKELQNQLSVKGHRFNTNTDTEVLVHLYEEQGDDFVKSLNGMFALALWDEDKKRLLLARDPLGVKPLYYAEWKGLLFFSSELKSLLCVHQLPRDLCPEAIHAYLLSGSIPAPYSIFRSIQKLPPGHRIIADKSGIRTEAYWSLPEPMDSPNLLKQTEEIEDLLLQAIKRQMVSDVPLGVFLSGGLDSSAVVAFASRNISTPLKTFSMGYDSPDQEYNELDKARVIAKHFGCEHREFILSPKINEILLPIVRSFDEPFANSTAVPTYLIAREARQHVIVALTGVGGDELFGGYPRYLGLLASNHLEKIPPSMRRKLSRFASLLPNPGGSINWIGRSKRFLQNINQPLHEQYQRWVSFMSPDLLELLIRKEGCLFKNGWKSRRSVVEYATPSIIAQTDLTGYLPSDLLCLTDRMSMAHSLEARVPFCDIPLVEFMARVPLSTKLTGAKLKSILKNILRPYLPVEILSQRKKGFSIPLARWIREELTDILNDCLNHNRLKDRGYFNPDVVDEMRRRHELKREDNADILWGLLIFELWNREYVDKAGID